MIANGSGPLPYALRYLAAGLSVIPIRPDGSKRAALPWKRFQAELPTEDEARSFWADGSWGVAAVCGKVSGYLETLDFDNAESFDRWERLASEEVPETLAKLVVTRTPRPGVQVAYRCPGHIEGNQKLALRRTLDDDGRETVTTLIETRGEGGYVLVPGSPAACHPTNRLYEFGQIGGCEPLRLEHVQTISHEERATLIRLARVLNEVIEDEPSPAPHTTNIRTGDDYNARGPDWAEILTPHGWTVGERGSNGLRTVCRPGKRGGVSGTIGCMSRSGNELLSVFSTNASPFPGPGAGHACSTHTRFDAYARLNHGGDHRAAAKELAARGYGEQGYAGGDHGDSGDAEQNPAPEILTAGALVQRCPQRLEAVIEGLLRVRETMNVIAAPKLGKSWCTLLMALSVAMGRRWLDLFDTRQSRVLIVDNELHPETLAHRLRTLAHELGVNLDDLPIDIVCLRGKLQDLAGMGSWLSKIPRGRYGLIIIDAFYRTLPKGTDENDNGSVASLYNLLDGYAEWLGSAFVLIHHSSKGDQSGKSVTDVGAGAGSQSRATDTHLVLRPHEEEGAVVLDAVARSWPPIAPTCLRWNWPIWSHAPELDPSALQLPGARRRKAEERDAKQAAKAEEQARKDHEQEAHVMGALDAIDPEGKGTSLRQVRTETGLREETLAKVIQRLTEQGIVRTYTGTIQVGKGGSRPNTRMVVRRSGGSSEQGAYQ